MLAEEGEELADVAPIGFDRLGRHLPLGREIGEPAHHLDRELGGGEGQLQLVRGLWHIRTMTPASLPFLKGDSRGYSG